ncbi:hypothetical protein GOP47_0026985 [Adiantum capillus-veneris]|nr:hypothetical protein GOP47_0026985 [Adiantum capillus-veneris]
MHAERAIKRVIAPSKKSFHPRQTSLDTLLEEGLLGDAVEAVEALSKQRGFVPSRVFVSLLHKCTVNKDLEAGKRVHRLMVRSGLGSASFYCDHLIRFYESCDNLKEANFVFHGASRPTVYTWNAIISVHIKLGKAEEALILYKKMQQQGTKPGKVTYLYCLKACGSLQDLAYGRYIHSQIVIGLLHIDTIVGSTLIGMYCKCGNLEDAQNVFNGFHQRNAVLWGAMIAGYVQIDRASCALELFAQMQQQDMKPDGHMFSSLLKACGATGAFRQGMVIYDKIIKHQLDIDVVIQNSLVDMYSKCGFLEDAHKVFDTSSKCNVISWGALIFGYVEHGEGLLALNLFHKVKQARTVKPSKAIFSCTLKACGMVKCIEQGMLIHEQILLDNLESDMVVGNALVDMYVKCSKLNDAYCVFCRLRQKDVISWGTIISGHVQLGQGAVALALVEEMQEQEITPDEVVITCSVKACAVERSRTFGQMMHDWIVRKNLMVSDNVYNTLVNMYVSCALLDDAQKVFDFIPSKDVVLWSIMIDGYIRHEQDFLALTLFMKMQHQSTKPDKYIYSCCLKACRTIGAVGLGRWIHDQVIRSYLETDDVVGGALVDMYTFCESVGEAQTVLARLPNQNEVSWGAIIASCAERGNYIQVQEFLRRMQDEGLKPNSVVRTSVLAACSHAGLLKEGFGHFVSATGAFEYSCMIDLLGRAGWFNQASDLMETMPMSPSVFSLAALLTGCRTYSNSGCAKPCFDEFIELNPREASGYVMMSSVTAADGSLSDRNGKTPSFLNLSGTKKKG